MGEDKKRGYPRIARSVWFGLRDKLKQRVPGEISPSYVAGIFGMEPASAAANVLPALRVFGLIDDNNKPLDRALDWRDDTKYAEVCQKIVDEVYPSELRDLYHTPDAPLEGVKAWFARSAKVGDAAANKFAITYVLLLEADVAKAVAPAQKIKPSGNGGPPKAKPAKAPKLSRSKPSDPLVGGDAAGGEVQHRATGGAFELTPKLHIDIQIHISPESSADQIDRIFESMAKHLKHFPA